MNLIGRDHELAAIAEALSAMATTGTAMVFVGEPVSERPHCSTSRLPRRPTPATVVRVTGAEFEAEIVAAATTSRSGGSPSARPVAMDSAVRWKGSSRST